MPFYRTSSTVVSDHFRDLTKMIELNGLTGKIAMNDEILLSTHATL